MSGNACGRGRRFVDPDTEAARAFFREKRVAGTPKLMSVREAVARFVRDGDYVASGGFGTNRIATAALHEVLRQGKRGLGFAGHTTTHDFQILASGNRRGKQVLSRVDAAYIVGLEARGLSPHARRVMQSGEVEVCEWTNFALACRFRAAAAGVPFMPLRSLMGTDTFAFSAAAEVECPFTNRKLVAVPALFPDVSLVHVHESDAYGNCRILGITVADQDIARASKRLIVTAERIVDTEEIRRAPHATDIPAFCVDAVCHVPFGSYPGNMPGEYFSDEEHLALWMEAEADLSTFEDFLRATLLDVDDFPAYLEVCGGRDRLKALRTLENLPDA